MIPTSVSPQILVVDDAATNLALARSVLSSEGFRTLEARNGREALEAARQSSPDLILLDVVMPDESGFETCSKLKSDPITSHIPVIFLSALDDVSSKVKGLRIGGVDFISKPFHRDEVLARVRVHLRIQQSNQLLRDAQRDRLEELRTAQQAILLKPEDLPEASFAVYNRPMQGAGGDFYEVTPIGDHLFGFFVADISGHGVGAAFLTSAIKAMLPMFVGPSYSPEDTLAGLDSVLRPLLSEGQYLTACHARLNQRTRQLSIVSAGHPPAIRVGCDGVAETLVAEGDPLGLFNSIVLNRLDVRLSPGDRIYFYTDGLIEDAAIAGGGRNEGTLRLLEACARFHDTPLVHAPKEIATSIHGESIPTKDDLLLLATELPQ